MHMFDVQAGQTRVKFYWSTRDQQPLSGRGGKVSGQTDTVGGKKGNN